jgi:hypothetical protein
MLSLRVLTTYFQVAFFFWKMKRSNQVRLSEELKSSSLKVPPQQREKMLAYSLFCRFVLCLSTTFHQRKATKYEEENAFYLGLMTPLADDLNDEGNLDFHEIEIAVQDNKMVHKSISLLKLFLGKLNEPLPEHYFIYLEKLKIAQNQSMQQQGLPPLDYENLLNLTFKKGAFSFLLYRSIFHAPISKVEEKCLAQIGYVLQLTNDLFDVYKDVQSGTQTPVTNCGDLNRFANDFYKAIDTLLIYLKDCAPTYSVYKSYVLLLSTILGRAYVCLEQHQKLLTTKDVLFQPINYPRKALICDMEHPINLWKSFRFSVQIVTSAFGKKAW